jgi:hypothetical protein
MMSGCIIERKSIVETSGNVDFSIFHGRKKRKNAPWHCDIGLVSQNIDFLFLWNDCSIP